MAENFFSNLQSRIENYDVLNEAEDFSFDVPEEAKSASNKDVQLGSDDPSDEERKDYDPTKDPEVSELIDSEDDTDDDDDYEDDDEEALEDAVEDNDPAHESLDGIIESVVGKTIDTELMNKVNSVYNESVLNLNSRTNEVIDYILEGYNGLLEGDKLLIEGLLVEENSIDNLFNNELLNESPVKFSDYYKMARNQRNKTDIVAMARIIRNKFGTNVKVKVRKANLAGKASEYIPQMIMAAVPLLIPSAIGATIGQAIGNKVWTFYVEKGGKEVWHKSVSLLRNVNPEEAAKAIESVIKTGKGKIGSQTIHESFGIDNLDEELFTYVENDEGGVMMLFDESLMEDEYGFYDETDAMDSILESANDEFMLEDTDWLSEGEEPEEETDDLEEGWYFEDDEDLEEASPVAIQADQGKEYDPLSSLKSMDEDWLYEEDDDEDTDLEESFWMESEDEEDEGDLEEGWYFESDDDDDDDSDDDDDDDDKKSDDEEDDDDDDDKDEDKDDDEDDDEKKNESFYDFGW